MFVCGGNRVSVWVCVLTHVTGVLSSISRINFSSKKFLTTPEKLVSNGKLQTRTNYLVFCFGSGTGQHVPRAGPILRKSFFSILDCKTSLGTYYYNTTNQLLKTIP